MVGAYEAVRAANVSGAITRFPAQRFDFGHFVGPNCGKKATRGEKIS
ncbi:MAG: hypothetical protein IIA00_03855 [Proteobacteria bacterium]|nr:hypothetical protein [Pseudomonadota bacterium]